MPHVIRCARARARRCAASGIPTPTLSPPPSSQAQYAVRGELVLRGFYHQQALERGEARPFSQLTFCNIGNPQELQQLPITFFRQVLALTCLTPLTETKTRITQLVWSDHPAFVVLALTCYPALLDDPNVGMLFPHDAIARARRYMGLIPGGTGAYSNSQGVLGIREEVAAFITERDGGVPAHASDIFLTDGASPAAQFIIRCLLRDQADAIMTPIPQVRLAVPVAVGWAE